MLFDDFIRIRLKQLKGIAYVNEMILANRWLAKCLRVCANYVLLTFQDSGTRDEKAVNLNLRLRL